MYSVLSYSGIIGGIMFRLYDLGDNLWQLHTRDFGAIEGSFRMVVSHMVFELEFTMPDIEIAISEMCKNDHNAADFGMFRSFIYSFNKENKSVA